MILMYHNVATTPLFYSSTTEELVEQMEVLDARGVEVVSLNRYLDALKKHGPSPNVLALTFDDAYVSFVEQALPVLERFGSPATVFVPTAHMGGVNDWDREADPEHFRILDAEALQALSSHPLVTIGSHGVTHRSLGRLGGDELEREICDSKRTLERLLETGVDLFSFPYGQRIDVPPACRAVLERCGYRAAVTTEWTRHPSPADTYGLGRIEITAGDHAAQFIRKLFGRPDLGRIRQVARNFKSLFAR